MPVMTNTTGSSTQEWIDHVMRMEAHFGRQVVSRVITDNAPYFQTKRFESFNTSKGIIHIQSPSYTQELNGGVERDLGTIISMCRSAMLESGAPPDAYGECVLAMCHTLDRLPHHSGGRLTRLEKWAGHLVPQQHDHLELHVWGCLWATRWSAAGSGTAGSSFSSTGGRLIRAELRR